ADEVAGGVARGFGGEELLVRGLVGEQEAAGGEKELHGAGDGEVPEELEVRGGEFGMHGGPSARDVDEHRQREAESEGGEQADEEVHVGHRGHAGDGGEDNDEGGDEVSAGDGRDCGG